MATIIEVCNLALNHLGQRSIASLTEVSEGARRCNIMFNSSRDYVLRSHSWNFATKSEALVAISGETIPGFDYLYTIPSLCLYVQKVYTEDTLLDPEPQLFSLVLSPTTNVKAIATNLEDAYIQYTKQVVDPTLWDPTFVLAMSYHLASTLAIPLNGSSDLARIMYDVFTRVIDEAMRMNMTEGAVKNENSCSFIDSRG